MADQDPVYLEPVVDVVHGAIKKAFAHRTLTWRLDLIPDELTEAVVAALRKDYAIVTNEDFDAMLGAYTLQEVRAGRSHTGRRS